jgi:hypothetical protein
MRAPFVYDPNADIEERAQIYVAKNIRTGSYSRGILSWFHCNSEWMKIAKPSDAEIREHLLDYISRSNPWTTDLQDADCWDGYWIDKFQKFLPQVEWRKAVLTTVPLDSN